MTIIILALFFIYTPSRANQNTTNDNLINIPIHLSEKSEKIIKGYVLLATDLASVPLRHQKLHLVQNDRLVLEAMTDLDGKFLFVGIIKKGTYKIKVASKKYYGEVDLNISIYDVRNVEILAKKKSR